MQKDLIKHFENDYMLYRVYGGVSLEKDGECKLFHKSHFDDHITDDDAVSECIRWFKIEGISTNCA